MTKPREGGNTDPEVDMDEVRKVAKQQLALDREMAEVQAGWREKRKRLTTRLREINMSRQAFQQPYENFVREQNADTPEQERRAKEDNILHMAKQKLAYEALAKEPLNWNKLFVEADKINKIRTKNAEKAEEDNSTTKDKAVKPTAVKADGVTEAAPKVH